MSQPTKNEWEERWEQIYPALLFSDPTRVEAFIRAEKEISYRQGYADAEQEVEAETLKKVLEVKALKEFLRATPAWLKRMEHPLYDQPSGCAMCGVRADRIKELYHTLSDLTNKLTHLR